ncbi:DNA internalization-related competence protein ComEC/Rec2 [Burkholderiaceae bacterium FT117]|uniref:DNA internalization-related competence protein ComEC/Rec2 n=1 Tax=Zeimonas sediminis TaxID=2944268 RepID=UPI002342EA86|nr:DNA internalization-related competence protein ComEC/Rec2 [Zeimonas sediminis]MCM5568916.1 DNA internalization-related competence protein ComEC/Rec2 [Zeimonas sediminis]
MHDWPSLQRFGGLARFSRLGGLALLGRLEPWLPPLPLAVLLAALAVHRLPALPPAGVASAAIVAGLACLAAARREGLAALRLAGLFVAAAGWTMLRADLALGARIVAAQEGVDFVVHGHVTGMPQSFERGERFTFRIESCVDPATARAPACPAGLDVRLAWYRHFGAGRSGASRSGAAGPEEPPPAPLADSPRPGERWQLTVRLKRPHALLNANAFDAELRALEEGIAATGYVRAGRDPAWPNRRLAGRSWRPGPAIEALRTVLRDAILAALADRRADAAGVVAALSVGDQAAIPGRWWDTFNRTGVGHLMSISGLHITMLAGMAGGLARRALRHPAIGRSAMLERLPADRLKWGFALAVAFGYSALAGWGIPAQRTCWMLAVAGFSLLGGRSQSLARLLALSAAVVTLLDPWAPLSAGFWLSFASVAAIVWYGTREVPVPSAGRHASRSWRARLGSTLADAIRTQWAATLSLLPLGALFFSSFSLVGPLANAFAIPLVSIVITPLALLGTALLMPFPPLGSAVLAGVCAATGWLLDALVPLAEPRFAIAVLPAPPWPVTLAAAAAIAALLAPFRLPGRPAAFAALLPLFAQADARPAPGSLVVNALDVGQGSAIVVETPAGRLLFDTGPRYGGGSEAGARVLVPWLRARGIERLEAVVVSHADDDHAGGSASVLAGVTVDWVASSLDDDHPALAGAATRHRCWRGHRWRWGEVDFEFLHPGPERTTSRKSETNASSCVLRIASPAGVVLLTGDIESAQERFLVEKLGSDALRADLLVAPHHGSNGSSSLPFLRAVAPALAIAQAGYRNRFRHPGDKAQARYRAAGIELLRTDRDGAVSVTLRGAGRPPLVTRLRRDDRRYWRIRVD